MRLRPIESRDLDSVLAIERLSQQAPWSRESFVALLSQQYFHGVVCEEEKVMGFCVYRVVGDEFELLDVAIHPQYRKKGIASQFIAHILQNPKLPVTTGYLEVRTTNAPAIALYHKWGFKQFGRRVRYYSDNGEDALLMRWEKSC